LRTCRALQERRIEVIVLKGAPLARRIFGSIGRREHLMMDNDLLVRSADLTRAVETLADLGYQVSRPRPLPTRLDVEFQLALTTLRHETLLRAEVHWAPFPPLLYPVAEELVWQRIERFDFGGLALQVFDPAMTLVHLASHFAQHGFSAQWVLRDLAQAFNTWHQRIEPKDLADLAERTGLIHALDFSLGAAQDCQLLKASPPSFGSARAAHLRKLLPADHLSDKRPRHDYVRALLAATLADSQRIPGWLRHQLFPPIEQMADIYGTTVSPSLYFRYATRLWRPLFRALKLGPGLSTHHSTSTRPWKPVASANSPIARSP
jgi:hypothetical protein